MELLNGKVISDMYKEEVGAFISDLRANDLIDNITLAVIQIGNDSASSVYINNKKKACEYVGIDTIVYHADDDVTEEEVIELIEKLNDLDEITGILLQLPLPKHLNVQNILSYINPLKDVDGFHALNIGNLVIGNESDALIPCTPLGIMNILDEYNIDVAGKECVVVGRSNIVGKPMAMLLLQADGTVTICHSKTENLKEICKRADILVCAIGKPKFFNRDYVKDGAVVIDVGIHRMDNGKLCGDVDFDDVKDVVSAITPVPNGVGSMTVAMLMNNLVRAAIMQRQDE